LRRRQPLPDERAGPVQQLEVTLGGGKVAVPAEVGGGLVDVVNSDGGVDEGGNRVPFGGGETFDLGDRRPDRLLCGPAVVTVVPVGSGGSFPTSADLLF
jgi:hypothetical protein